MHESSDHAAAGPPPHDAVQTAAWLLSPPGGECFGSTFGDADRARGLAADPSCNRLRLSTCWLAAEMALVAAEMALVGGRKGVDWRSSHARYVLLAAQPAHGRCGEHRCPGRHDFPSASANVPNRSGWLASARCDWAGGGRRDVPHGYTAAAAQSNCPMHCTCPCSANVIGPHCLSRIFHCLFRTFHCLSLPFLDLAQPVATARHAPENASPRSQA